MSYFKNEPNMRCSEHSRDKKMSVPSFQLLATARCVSTITIEAIVHIRPLLLKIILERR